MIKQSIIHETIRRAMKGKAKLDPK